MKYCRKCRTIFEDDITTCLECKDKLTYKVNIDDEVFLIKAYGFELERIKAALEDKEIPYIERLDKKERSAQAITGKNDALTNLYTTVEKYEYAIDLLYSIGAIKPEEDIEEDIKDEFDDMSPRKRTIVRIVSIVLFIIIVWLVVSGVDFIAALIKNML